jgi:hypothetical protein
MFALSLVDTLRLAFGHVVYYYKSHTRAATSLARWNRWFKAAETLLMLGVVITAVAAASGRGHAYIIANAVMASMALLILLIHVTFDFESTARAHHVCSTRLWSIREQYRALLSDLNDQAIEPEAARTRRNTLMQEVSAIQDSAPPLTQRVFKVLPDSAEGDEELALADKEIDRFLPGSLRAEKVAPAPS